ncbi:MAG: hypothetical protein WA460_08835 [Nitrososphaeraceae archaeon]
MNRNLVLTCLVLVMGISLSIVGQSGSELIDSASAQITMDNGTDATNMAQGNMTAGAGNMTDSNTTGSGNISGCGNECF